MLVLVKKKIRKIVKAPGPLFRKKRTYTRDTLDTNDKEERTLVCILLRLDCDIWLRG